MAASPAHSVEFLPVGPELPDDVHALLSRAEQVSMQCGPEWFSALTAEVFARQGQASWLVLREAGRCTAVWPVLWAQSAGALSNYYTALYQPTHANDMSEAGLLCMAAHLRKSSFGRGELRFGPMDPQTPEFEAMQRALGQAGYRTYRYFRFANWYLPCKGINWDHYFAERKGAMRSTVRRMSKKLDQDGGTLEVITGGERLELGIAAYEQVYSSSWKQSEPYPGFIRELIRVSAKRGWLRLGVAWLNGKAIAAQLWLVAHGRAEIFKVAYDESFKTYTAGTLLTAKLMQHVLDVDRVHEVDYLIGDDVYKKTWMSERRERWGLVAYDPWTLAGATGIVRTLAGRLKRRLRPPQIIAAKA